MRLSLLLYLRLIHNFKVATLKFVHNPTDLNLSKRPSKFEKKKSFNCAKLSLVECYKANSTSTSQYVPGYPTLSTNIMARIWKAVPGLQHESTLGAAKSFAKKWAKDIPR